MKKIFFMMGCSALVLSSCSQEDVLGINNSRHDENAIAFRVRSAKLSRSAEFSTDNLTDFMVYGFKGDPDAGETVSPFFNTTGDPVKFSRIEEDGVYIFTSNPTYYYPADGSAITMAAYAPSTLTGFTTDLYGGLKKNFTVDADMTKQIDLICAEGVTFGHEDGIQELTFQHTLTKVFVSEVLNDNPDFKYEIIGVKFGNIHNSGNFEYKGQRFVERSEDDQNEVFGSDGYIADGGGKIFWKPAGEPTAEFSYIFDEPVIVDQDNKRPTIMTGDDTAENASGKQSFMMVPQQLSADFVNEQGTALDTGTFQDGIAYIAFLVRITNTVTNDVVYPYAEGVENISETIDGVTYAWAAFPVCSLWVPGNYVDYFVDFTKGPGFVAPGADEALEYQPILGPEIKFTSDVVGWSQGGWITVDQDNHLTIDHGEFEDPFGD